MSSTAYFAELRAEPALRHRVALVGAFLLAAGDVSLLTLSVSPVLQVAAMAAWTAGTGWELTRIIGCWRTYVAMHVAADGTAKLLDRAGAWHEARLQPGSILLARWGWIRLAVAGGPVFAEPCCRASQNSLDWRRLQVIWRHVGAPG